MKKLLALGIITLGISISSFAQDTKMVGGAAMYPSKNIVENAVNSKDHTTLVAAVKAAGLVECVGRCRTVYRFCPYQRSFRYAARRYRSYVTETRK